MRLIKQHFERDGSGSVTLYPEDPEDMWQAYNLILPTDTLRSSALRRITTTSNTGSTTSTRIHTTLTIRVRSLDFDTQAAQLHVSGTIVEENEYVKMGAFHTLDLALLRNFTISKDGVEGGSGWDSVARGIVKEACDGTVKGAGVSAWCVIFQEGWGSICALLGERTVVKGRVEVNVPRKRGGGGGGTTSATNASANNSKSGVGSAHETGLSKFFGTLLATLLRHVDLSTTNNNNDIPILLASPGFTATSFQKYVIETATRKADKTLLSHARKNMLVVHSSSGHVHSLNEVLRDPTVQARLSNTRYFRETALMDRFFSLLRKDDARAWYGAREVERAVERGGVGKGGGVLLISNSLFRSADLRVRKRFVGLVDRVREREGGEVRVLSSEHESGRRLEGLGGVAAILTWPIEGLDEGLYDDDDGGGGEGSEGVKGEKEEKIQI